MFEESAAADGASDDAAEASDDAAAVPADDIAGSDASQTPVEGPQVTVENNLAGDPQIAADNNPAGEPQVDADNTPVEDPQVATENTPVEESVAAAGESDDVAEASDDAAAVPADGHAGSDASQTPVEGPQVAAENNPVEDPQVATENNPAGEPQATVENTPVEEIAAAAEASDGAAGESDDAAEPADGHAGSDASQTPVEGSQVTTENNPVEDPQVDADNNPVEDIATAAEAYDDAAEPANDIAGSDEPQTPVEGPQVAAANNPAGDPQVAVENIPVEDPQVDAENSPAGEPQATAENNPVEDPQVAAENNPVEEIAASAEASDGAAEASVDAAEASDDAAAVPADGHAGSGMSQPPVGDLQNGAGNSLLLESAAAAGVSNVVYEPCQYSPGFNRLSFDITGDDGTKFSCLITGLKEKEGGRPVTQEGCEELAETIAMIFLNSSCDYNITDDPLYSPVDLVPIDAEKYSIDRSSMGNWEDPGYPAGDAELCWAASASNMLTYAGWLTNEFHNEDELFTEITKSFFDIAGNEVYAFDWYMDGINPIQDAVTDETGDVAVIFPEKYVGINGAQLKEKETGRYLPEYAASSVSSNIRVELLGAAAVSDYLTDNLDEGNAVSLSFRHVAKEDFADYGGHAIGVFGYIKEKLCEAGAALRALFISNSDDCASGDPTVIYSPKETEEIRKTAVNNYTMKRVSVCVDPGGRDMIDMRMSGDDMYSPIFDVSILKPKTLCEDSKETTGTMDSRNDFNMVPTWLGIINDGTFNPDEPIYAGDVLTIWSETEDKSYRFFSPSETPYLEYSYEIYKDGQFYKSIELETEVYQFNPEPGFPAKANSKSTHNDFSYTFYEPGEYKVKLVVNGLYSVESGIRKDLKEAYTTDNELDKIITFTVLPKKDPPVVPTEEPVNIVVPAEEPVSPVVPSEQSVSRKIYCGVCVLKNTADGLGIVFDCSCDGFRELIMGNKTVDKDYYSVSVSQTGRYILNLSREYLGILGAGVHYLHLETDCESVWFKVTIL